MSEEDFKTAVKNLLMLQNNNDHNFQILQAQLDKLQEQINDLNDLKQMFRLPKPENKNRKLFDEADWLWVAPTSVLSWHMWLHLFHKWILY